MFKTIRINHLFSRLLGCALLATLLATPARADLLISPTRVLLTEQQPVTQVILRNTGALPRTYRMEWREMRRDDSGTYHSIDNPTPADRTASHMLRYSPRQITLAAGETQTVRVQYQPQAGLSAGEYRSHLLFTTVGGASASDADSASQRAEAVIRVGLAFSIPVIVRVGPPEDVQVSIPRVQPRVETNPADGVTRLAFDVTIARSGAYSSFGDINIYMQTQRDTAPVLVGKSTDFAVFADAAQRPITIPLRDDMRIPSGAWIRIAYDGKQEFEGRTLAEQVFQIQ